MNIVINRELLSTPGQFVPAVTDGACSKRSMFITPVNNQYKQYKRQTILAPVWVGNGYQHGTRTNSREVVTIVAFRPSGMWPGNSRLTAHGDSLRGHAVQAERVATDARGLRRAPPPWRFPNARRILKNRI